MARDDPRTPPVDFGLALGFLAISLIWGSTWLIIKGQLGVVPPSWSVAYRFLLGAALLAAWCGATGKPLRLGRSGHAFALLVGVTQFALNFNLVYRSELYLTSGLVALVYTLLVVTNAVFARAFLGQRVSARFAFGSAIGIAGVGLLVGRDLGGANVRLGLALALGGLFMASIANVLQASRRGRAMPLEAGVVHAMLYGGLINAAAAAVTAGPPVFDTNPHYWLGLAYLAAIASATAFIIYYNLIRRLGAARAGYVNVVVPVIAMTLSTVFEHYHWTPAAAAGAALALLGLYVALSSRR
jgi:drug/metabolite transporter (DMT)-like permease